MDKPYYSKAIIDRFLHPRNVGKIKNADGVGDTQNLRCGDIMKIYITVGKKDGKEVIKDAKFETMGCLPPDEKVLINQGDWGKISSIQTDSKVLNGNGRETQVMRVFKRRYKGPTLTLVPFVSPFNRFSVTPEHPIFCIKRSWLKSARRRSKKCGWLQVNHDELLSIKPDYVPAKELEKSDYLVFVPNKKIKDDSRFTSALMKLLGYYLAEGYIYRNRSNKSYTLTFSLNKNEKENISQLKGLLVEITGKEPRERIRRNVIEIQVLSKKWVDFFDSVASHYASRKTLSEDILILPFKKQWEMIKTYIKGDGCLTWRRENDTPRYEITTASKKLAIQIQEILARGGIFSSIRRRKKDESRNHIEGRVVNAGPVYDILFKLKRKNKFIHIAKNYFLVPIKRIIKNKYVGHVYNILVKGIPNSYLVKGFAVHNCGHAVAISDMMCDLIKGKTFQEAMKVGYEDIANEIGPVPPVKIHCAKLAQTAIKAAIENYQNKKAKL